MERVIQYLRELAALQRIYFDPNNTQLPTDPGQLHYTPVMWWKFVQSVPSLYANSLAIMQWKDEEAPMVN